MVWKLQLHIFFHCIICTCVIAGGASKSNNVQPQCGWMTPNACGLDNGDKPVIGLAFVHMRKAGGTNIIATLKRWLVARGCAPQNAVQHGVYGTYGIRAGNPILLDAEEEKKFPQQCVHLDFSNNEYGCVDGRGILQHPFLNLTAHRKEHFAMLTTLRDPIERIGSQAFYRAGPGVEAINRITRSMCGVGSRTRCRNSKKKNSPVCECVSNAKEATKVELRSNDDAWMAWANKSYTDPNGFMGDNYAAEYYIRRLVKDPHVFHGERRPERECLDLVSKRSCSSSLSSLNTFAHRVHCVKDLKVQEPPERLDDGLIVAKNLLKYHFDFIITEYMDTPKALRVMKKVLFDPSYDPPVTRVNQNVLVKTSSYTDFMSPAVVKYFQRDNARDIELYNYALKLFLERYQEDIN